MLLDDIATYLSTSGLGTIGTNLFQGVMPEAPDVALALYETGGQSPVYAMNPNAGAAVVERPRLQIVARATAADYQVARGKLEDVAAVLDGLGDTTINGVRYLSIVAMQSPLLSGRDAQGRVLIACNYDVTKAMSP